MNNTCKNVLWLQAFNIISVNVLTLLVPVIYAVITQQNVYEVICKYSSNAVAYTVTMVLSALPMLLYYRFGKVKREITKVRKRLKPREIFKVSLILIALEVIGIFAYIGIENGLNLVGLTSKVSGEGLSYDSPFHMFIITVLIAPILEEVLYRGVILNTFREHGRAIGVIISALLFSMAHGNIYQCTYTFLAGLVFGTVAVKYGLRYSIILHTINNAFSMLIDKFEIDRGVKVLLALAIVGLVILMLTLWNSVAKDEETEDDITISAYLKEVLLCMKHPAFIVLAIIWVLFIGMGLSIT